MPTRCCRTRGADAITTAIWFPTLTIRTMLLHSGYVLSSKPSDTAIECASGALPVATTSAFERYTNTLQTTIASGAMMPDNIGFY